VIRRSCKIYQDFARYGIHNAAHRSFNFTHLSPPHLRNTSATSRKSARSPESYSLLYRLDQRSHIWITCSIYCTWVSHRWSRLAKISHVVLQPAPTYVIFTCYTLDAELRTLTRCSNTCGWLGQAPERQNYSRLATQSRTDATRTSRPVQSNPANATWRILSIDADLRHLG
jgi:hypothetical protein